MVFLLVLTFILALWYYPILPERLATHFSFAGNADGWMDKDAFFVLYSALFVFLGGTFMGMAPLIRRLPDSMINVPHREYWLAPERRSESLASMTAMLSRIGEATLLLLLVLMALTFDANTMAEPRLGSATWLIIAAYLGFVAWQTVRLLRHFNKPGT